MKQKDVIFIAAGLGVLYLVTRPTFGGTVPAGNTPIPAGGVPGVGSFIGSLTNLISGFLGPGVPVASPSNPSINPVNSPGSYPNFTGNEQPAGDTYNPCDPSSVAYSPDVCTEMYPNG